MIVFQGYLIEHLLEVMSETMTGDQSVYSAGCTFTLALFYPPSVLLLHVQTETAGSSDSVTSSQTFLFHLYQMPLQPLLTDHCSLLLQRSGVTSTRQGALINESAVYQMNCKTINDKQVLANCVCGKHATVMIMKDEDVRACR